MKRYLSLSLALFLPVALFAYVSPGAPTGFVNDFAHILKSDTVISLNTDLTNFSQKTTSEIAVVTVPSIGDETIEVYSSKLFEEYKIGKAKQDNGVLLLVDVADKQMRIEVGYGLEPVITDIESKDIIDTVLKPAFQAGDYDAGMTAAVKRLETDALNGYPVVASAASPDQNATRDFWIHLAIILFIAIIIHYLSRRSGRGGIPPIFWGGFGGGGFGGGSSRGGGFGGFSGGSSGGGGASGSW